MQHNNLLFSKYGFASIVRAAPSALRREVDELDDETLFGKDQASLIDRLVASNLIQVPRLKREAVKVTEREVNLDISHDRYIDDVSAPHFIKATEISFQVPFEGDPRVFECRPSTYSLNPPSADVEPEAIVIRVIRRDHNTAEYRKTFDETIQKIETPLEQLRSDCAGLEQNLRRAATSRLEERREKRTKDRGLIDELGFGGSQT